MNIEWHKIGTNGWILRIVWSGEPLVSDRFSNKKKDIIKKSMAS